MLTPGELEALLLHLMRAGPRHGYDLTAEIEHRSGAAYAPSPGTIYPALQRLERKGWTTTLDQPSSKRRAYGLTAQGEDQLQTLDPVVSGILRRLNEARPALDACGDQIRAAMMRLDQALCEHQDRIPKPLEAQIAARIDDLSLMLRRGAAPFRTSGEKS